MSSLVWNVEPLTTDVEEAVTRYVRIGEDIKNNEIILNLKEKIKTLAPVCNSIRSFLAYVMPSFSGKTQSVFAFGGDLLPLYFSIGYSKVKEQPIYNAYTGNYDAIVKAHELDGKISQEGVATAHRFFDPVANSSIPLYLLGLLDAMIELAHEYRNLTEKPCSWMEYSLAQRSEQIWPMSIVQFHAKYVLDERTRCGFLSSSLKDIVIVLDEFPSIENLPNDSNATLKAVSLAQYARNLCRAVGLSVMTMGTDSSVLNLVGQTASASSRNYYSSHLTEQLWCIGYIEGAPLEISSLIRESSCSTLFRMDNIDDFKYELFPGIDDNMVSILRFIINQIKTSRPGIGAILLDSLFEIWDNGQLEHSFFWDAFCRLVSINIYKIKNLDSEDAVKANCFLMVGTNRGEKTNEHLSRYVNKHLFRMGIPAHCADAQAAGPLYSFKLYRPAVRKTVLRYQSVHSPIPINWLYNVRLPDPTQEFFIYLASWGYCRFFDKSMYGASSSSLAVNYKELADKGYQLYGVKSGDPKPDSVMFEHICIASLCNASHSASFGKITDGNLFFREFATHLIASDSIPLLEDIDDPQIFASPPDQYLNDTITFSIDPHCLFTTALAQFQIPYLGPSNTDWSDEFIHSMSDFMKLGNMNYHDDKYGADISFDVIKNGVFKKNGGIVEAKFRKQTVSSPMILKYLTGMNINTCPLVFIACAIGPDLIYQTQARTEIEQLAQEENINIYVAEHRRLPFYSYNEKTSTLLQHLNMVDPLELHIYPLVELGPNPNRVMVIVESYFSLPSTK